MKTQRAILGLLLAAVVVQVIHYYPQLPSTVASHFGRGGQPNGWSSKEAFFGLYLGIVAVLLLAFVGLPVLLRRISPAWINVPNREYWLAPERREMALAVLRFEMLWFGNATLALMASSIQLAIQANLPASAGFSEPTMWLLLGSYLVFTVVWLIRFYRRFAKPG